VIASRISLLFVAALTTACATSADPVPVAEVPEPIADQPDTVDRDLLDHPVAVKPIYETPAAAEEQAPLLDRTQRTVEGVVTGTAQTVDNIFGSAEVEEEATVTRGRLSVGGQWDQRDGLRERIRLKARFGLPAVNKRTSLLLGRGDVNDFVDGSSDDNIDTLPDRFNDFQDEDWLLGIGYSRDATLRRGWSFGAGVRLKTPLEPFVRASRARRTRTCTPSSWGLAPRACEFPGSSHPGMRGSGASTRCR